MSFVYAVCTKLVGLYNCSYMLYVDAHTTLNVFIVTVDCKEGCAAATICYAVTVMKAYLPCESTLW